MLDIFKTEVIRGTDLPLASLKALKDWQQLKIDEVVDDNVS